MSAVRRSAAALGVLAAVAWTAGPAAAAAGPKPGTTTGGSVAQTGWWWKANDTPVDTGGVVSPPEPPVPAELEDTLPVSALAGDPEKISGIAFALKYGPGATVTSFQLTLKESAASGANAGADLAKVIACPVTEAFWIGGPAAQWKAVPEYDCEQAQAEGKRDASGVWSFDLTSMASAWLATGSTQPTSIVLVENAPSPESFQVAFDGSKEGVGLDLKATGGAPPPPVPTTPVGGGDAGSVGTGTGDLGSGSVPADAGDLSGGAPVGGDVPAAADPAGGTPAPAAAPQQVATGQGAQLVGLFEDLPGGALALLPIGLLLAYLTMLALGPNGEPVLATARHGVGRALDRMRATRAKEVE